MSQGSVLEHMIFTLGEVSPLEPLKATPMSKHVINEETFHEIAETIYQRINVMNILEENELINPETIFSFKADTIQGDFEKDLEKFQNEDPRLIGILVKHHEVFGELPPI